MPETVKKLFETTNRDRRNFAKGYDVDKELIGKSKLFDLLKIDSPEVKQVFYDFGIKLTKALHYKHTGKIIPIEGGIDVLLRTTAQVAKGAIPKSVFQALNKEPRISRGKRNYENQFIYRYQVSEDGTLGMYLIQLRALFFVGFVAFDKSVLSDHSE